MQDDRKWAKERGMNTVPRCASSTFAYAPIIFCPGNNTLERLRLRKDTWTDRLDSRWEPISSLLPCPALWGPFCPDCALALCFKCHFLLLLWLLLFCAVCDEPASRRWMVLVRNHCAVVAATVATACALTKSVRFHSIFAVRMLFDRGPVLHQPLHTKRIWFSS